MFRIKRNYWGEAGDFTPQPHEKEICQTDWGERCGQSIYVYPKWIRAI